MRHFLTDAQVEALMTGRHDDPEFFDLAATLDGIRRLRDMRPSTPADELIANAARIAAASAPAPQPRVRPRRAWRFAPALASAALAMTLTAPVAVMANTAAPGDLLYGVDRFFEKIGIGDGGFAERLLEAKGLHARGKVGLAAEHLAAAVSAATSDDVSTHMAEVAALVSDLTVANPADPEAVSALTTLVTFVGDDSPAVPENPNSGPGNNSGNGNPDPGQDNPNKGPGNSQGSQHPGQGSQDPGQGEADGDTGSPAQAPAGSPDEPAPSGEGSGPAGGNPNAGPGNNSGNGNQTPGSGNDNPNAGPGNNSGNGNPNPGQPRKGGRS